jgi:hypothetical protein
VSNASYAAGCNGGTRDPDGAGSALLPANPFYAPRYHFGMLLGVDDFETEQAYHRGKLRLHNAWLHGEGVVWGLRVSATEQGDPAALTGEIRVEPGFALDAAGRELYLEHPACLSLPAWYEANREELDLEPGEDGAITFNAHVIACFRACVARPVPAISEPCVGAGTDTAYSRARETVELRLVLGDPPERHYPYHRLRLLFGLADPVEPDDEDDPYPDSQVVADREAILALDAEEQPPAYLEAFRRLAAYDEMDLAPAALRGDGGESLLFPADDDTCVVLAAVNGITLRSLNGRLTLTDLALVDNTVRPSHVATATIQELLCGPLFSALAGVPAAPEDEEPEEEEPGDEEPEGEEPEGDGEGGSEPGEPGENGENGEPGENGEEAGNGGDAGSGEPGVGERGGRPAGDAGRVLSPRSPVAEHATGRAGNDGVADAGGPRIDAGYVGLEGDVITLRVSSPLSRQSVTPAAFSVSSYHNRTGWQALGVATVSLDSQARTVSLELRDGVRDNLIRVIARGTGPTPLLGTNLVPLAGAGGGPPGTEHDGHDFVFMLTRSET